MPKNQTAFEEFCSDPFVMLGIGFLAGVVLVSLILAQPFADLYKTQGAKEQLCIDATMKYQFDSVEGDDLCVNPQMYCQIKKFNDGYVITNCKSVLRV